MMRYFRLLGVFLKGSFQSETAYRFNFSANMFRTLLNLGGSIGGLAIVFNNTSSINGWGYNELAALLGVYLLVLGLKDLVIGPGLEALSGLSGDLWTGQFDYVLLKPVQTQFYISFRKWSIWSVVDIAFAVVILAVSVSGTFRSVTVSAPNASDFSQPGRVLLFITALLISLVLVYSVLLILASAAFRYLGTPLMWIFDSLIQTGRYPVGIYPGALRIVLTWLIPVGFMITVPAQALSGTSNMTVLAGGACLAAALFCLSAVFFRSGIRKYSSASS